MLREKSHSTSRAFHDLNDAIFSQLELGAIPQGLWVQKFIEHGEELWEVACFKAKGKSMLSELELKGLQKTVEETKNDDELEILIDALESIIERRWDEKNTIEVQETAFRDHYDMYGLNRRDFA